MDSRGPSAIFCLRKARRFDPLIQNAFLVGDDKDGAADLAAKAEYVDKAVEAPEIDARLRLIEDSQARAPGQTTAISMRLISPPDRLAFTSRSM